MKKVLFYIHSLNKGGAERVLLTIANRLKNEYNVVILTDKVDEREYSLPEGIRRINIENELANNNVSSSTINRLKAIRSTMADERPDCIIAFMLSSAMRAIVATMFSRYRVVAAVRSNPYDDFGSFKKRLIVNALFSLAPKVVCQTEVQKGFFYKWIQNRCVLVFNPLFEEFQNSSYNGERSKRIVATGRLYDYKNHELLIRAFSTIASDHPDVDVVIYGEGPHRGYLSRLIDECGLEGRAILAGDSDNVVRDIRDAMIYVLPSDTEGMPNALMEAMALGLPVVSTDCPGGGPATLINNRVNGILVPVNDVAAMEKAIDELLKDEKLRNELSKEAIKIKDICDIENIINTWIDIIEN